ncbi:hypothetical protein DICVIV_02007 [Dictyocaulus viviparus]|uniref:Uncharacterized protein n=1 Tax=Dictyocaulus viviparus TaxID=29172 RepID=A0A0D8YB87_DICVI|nr:hypothetical protein DICVIV_02007 [Dictyocaulus viviparus]
MAYADGEEMVFTEETRVEFGDYPDYIIRQYVESGKPLTILLLYILNQVNYYYTRTKISGLVLALTISRAMEQYSYEECMDALIMLLVCQSTKSTVLYYPKEFYRSSTRATSHLLHCSISYLHQEV